MSAYNIVLAGIGGQGILLVANVIGAAAVADGLNVRVGGIHGMAQRGGAVVSTVRVGEGVLAPFVLEGEADVLLGFEVLETVRNLRYASERTLVITNSESIVLSEFSARQPDCPSLKGLVEKIRLFTSRIVVVEAADLAKAAGSRLAQNSVLLGTLAAVKGFPVKQKSILEALAELVPKKHVEVNVRAFDLGRKKMREFTQV